MRLDQTDEADRDEKGDETDMTTQTALDDTFDLLNKQFFHGRLPKFTVRVEKLTPPLCLGECDNKAKVIRLSPLVARHPSLRETMLHEMCHIGRAGHGDHWKARMRRLVKQGETWAQEELERYVRESPCLTEAEMNAYMVEHPETPTQTLTCADLRMEMKDLLQNCAYLQPRPGLRTVRALAAHEVFCFPKELDHRYPWWRRTWQRMCREADAEERVRRRFESMDRTGGEDRTSEVRHG